MGRRVVGITLDNLRELPGRCRDCVFWELDPVAGERACASGDPALEKEAWVSDTLLEWGSCGSLLYVDGVPAGYVTYAPPAYVPRSVAFATSPPSPDAVLLMTARLRPEFTGGGLGRSLVQACARDVARRGIRAIEAFGRTGTTPPAALASAAPLASAGAPGEPAELGCLLPADYLRAVGFKTVRRHPRTPRLRLDIRTTLTWREDVEYALDRLLAGVQIPATAAR